MNSSIANRAQNKKSCGNAGSVERVENQRQVFHSSHRPLEISPTPRDFHIPTAQAGRAWKSGKPKSGFPLSHTRPATMTTIPFKTSKSKPNLAASGGQRTNQRRRGSRRKMSSPYARLPGSPRTGNETHFQAHSALEINIDFRLTFGLENALATAPLLELLEQKFQRERNVSWIAGTGNRTAAGCCDVCRRRVKSRRLVNCAPASAHKQPKTKNR